MNASDDLILKKHKINVESGEDIFRFYLLPEYAFDLPRITTSVLKTRSTLSIHKVQKYLIKKINEVQVDEGLHYEDYQVQVVITCNGEVLDLSKQLKDLFWPFEDRLLTL